jgi:hypothetical protein
MRLFLVNFAGFAAMSFLQIHCLAGDDVLKDKIVRATLNHDEPALIKVGTTGVTSLEFPYRIEAIDGYGFSQTPAAGDAFQISYTKGTNYLSVRALKPGVTGNLTIVLDQKVYAIFFEESNNPSFVHIFAAAGDSQSTAPGEKDAAEEKKVALPAQLEGKEPDSDGLTFSQPPGDFLPTTSTLQEAGPDPEITPAQKQGPDRSPLPAPSPAHHAIAKKVAKKSDPQPDKSPKESVAKTQKPLVKKLFGWL